MRAAAVREFDRVRLIWISALAGLLGGVVSVAYLTLLGWAMRWLWPGPIVTWQHTLLLVGIGIAIAAMLACIGDPGETGVLIHSIHVSGGPPRVRPLLSLVPVSLVGIAVGGGIGPEPPLMQTTATLSSWLGRRFRMTTAELRVLTVTGMAAGLTTLFAAPLGAAIFALEILHRKGLEHYEALIPSFVGSLTSYVAFIVLTGRGRVPVWPFPRIVGELRLTDVLLGLAGGIGGAVLAHLFGQLIRLGANGFGRLPAWSRPPLAGRRAPSRAG